MRVARVFGFRGSIACSLVDDRFRDLRKISFLSCFACSARHASNLTVGSDGVNAIYFFLEVQTASLPVLDAVSSQGLT